MDLVNDPLYLRVITVLEGLDKKVEETAARVEQERAASRLNDKLESRIDAERNLHRELAERAGEAARRGAELARLCAHIETRLTVTESDQARLNKAKEMYNIAKELTGIRWDFTAPATVAKGYVKNKSRRLLEPFEVSASGDAGAGALWGRVSAPGDQENIDPNL